MYDDLEVVNVAIGGGPLGAASYPPALLAPLSGRRREARGRRAGDQGRARYRTMVSSRWVRARGFEYVRGESRPARPERDGQHRTDDADDHEDHADRVNTEAARLRRPLRTHDCAGGDQMRLVVIPIVSILCWRI